MKLSEVEQAQRLVTTRQQLVNLVATDVFPFSAWKDEPLAATCWLIENRTTLKKQFQADMQWEIAKIDHLLTELGVEVK